MNCYEFMANLVKEIDFVITVTMNEDQVPSLQGDVEFTKTYQYRWLQVCDSLYPRRAAYDCNRFQIYLENWAGGTASKPPDQWDTSKITPPQDPYAFHSFNFLWPKPWDNTDPYYERGVAVWENRDAYQHVTDFWFGSPNLEDPANIWIMFERFEDGATGVMVPGPPPLPWPWEVENPIGTATVRIQKKAPPTP
jgi:hypothetical protein